jgi:hypothetical protein
MTVVSVLQRTSGTAQGIDSIRLRIRHPFHVLTPAPVSFCTGKPVYILYTVIPAKAGIQVSVRVKTAEHAVSGHRWRSIF